ncbi:MAG TPA: PIN domain-containing protein [Opitutaceae bacterium]|nr:PIN domain-containing protein [Opitutaceae bacterium]
MKTVFADAFFFLALLNPSDGAHWQSVEFNRSLLAYRMTTTWVLTEVADAMSRPAKRGVFLEFIAELERNPAFRIEPTSEALYRRGLAHYADRPDKDWSLTDCISFVVMRENGIGEALTGDHHFTRAGFTPLLD